MSPAVERLIEWCEDYAADQENPGACELAALISGVRNEDPVAEAFRQARARFRRTERKVESGP